LDHLVDGAVALGEVLMGKAKCEVVNDLRFLEGEEVPVISALRQYRLMGGLGIMGIMGGIFPMIRMIRMIRMIPISSHNGSLISQYLYAPRVQRRNPE
jgi:hypothetical protein